MAVPSGHCMVTTSWWVLVSWQQVQRHCTAGASKENLGTSGSGQKPSQKETLTAAWVVQPRSRRTMVFTRTWQESTSSQE